MIYTLDSLLTILGQELPLGNASRHRLTVKNAIRYVMAKVGYEKTAYTAVVPFQPVDGVIEPLPDYILTVQDAGFSPDRMEGELYGRAGHSKNPLAFILTPTGIEFPNLRHDGREVYLQVETLATDNEKRVVINENIYQACHDYCYALLLTQFPMHPRFSQHMQLKNEALGMIDFTRAQLNKNGRQAQSRMLRRYN